jgi:hypothetical protein
MLLKRYMAMATSALYGVAVSTQKAQRSAISWMHYWISALKGERPIEYAIEHITSFLNLSARRANPKRDSGSLSMKLRLFEASLVDEMVKNQP